MPDPYRWIDKSLRTIHKANWYRQVQEISGQGGPVVTMAGRSNGQFCE